MQEKVSDTKASPKGDLDPHWNWGRQLPAWGAMGVDFESRVEFDRMRRYRLARARQALENSDLGALLLFDVNNIRYVSATKIGEWERDKLARFALLARGPGADRVGLRLRRRAPQALLALAAAGALQGRPRGPARHRAAELRPHAAPRRGDRLAPARGRRRQACRSASTSSSRR